MASLELVMRWVEPRSAPGTTYGRVVSRNGDGFRDRSYQIPKPDGVGRILVLGDSFSWGVGLDLHETLPKQLEAALNRQSSLPVEVVNASLPGMNTTAQLEQLRTRGLRYEPDLILLIYVLNDAERSVAISAHARPDSALEQHHRVEVADHGWYWFDGRAALRRFQRASALARFVVPRGGRLLHRSGLIRMNSAEQSWEQRLFASFVESNMGWLESKAALKEIAEIAHTKAIPFIVAIYPLLVEFDDYQGRHAHRTIEQYLLSLRATRVIDLLQAFAGANGRSYWINYADAHPNAEAHRLATALLVPVLSEQLARFRHTSHSYIGRVPAR